MSFFFFKTKRKSGKDKHEKWYYKCGSFDNFSLKLGSVRPTGMKLEKTILYNNMFVLLYEKKRS